MGYVTADDRGYVHHSDILNQHDNLALENEGTNPDSVPKFILPDGAKRGVSGECFSHE